jgi:hypothetical protein
MDIRGRRYELLASGFSNVAWAVMILGFFVTSGGLHPGDSTRDVIALVILGLVIALQLPALVLIGSRATRGLGAAKWLPTLIGVALRIGAAFWLTSFIRSISHEGAG